MGKPGWQAVAGGACVRLSGCLVVWLRRQQADDMVAILQVSIGLPKMLLDQDKKTTVVLIYVFVLVVIVPLIVFAWYARFSLCLVVWFIRATSHL